MSKHLLLTGCTGLLGQYLLRDLLLDDTPLAVLIRARKHEPAAERLHQVVNYWQGELGRRLPRPVCLQGDITLPGLGLSARDRAWLAGKDRGRDPWLANVSGTANVLELCRHARLREMHYVSTAYVCGLRGGVIGEDEFDRGQEFRNDYEHSKFAAEQLVRGADFLDQATVYRPAIIVGDSRSGYTTTYHGLYCYLYFGY